MDLGPWLETHTYGLARARRYHLNWIELNPEVVSNAAFGVSVLFEYRNAAANSTTTRVYRENLLITTPISPTNVIVWAPLLPFNGLPVYGALEQKVPLSKRS